MKLCRTYCGVFGDWGWEEIREDGNVEESREVFETFDECVADAWRHGYMVRRAPRLQPQSTVFAPRRVDAKAAVAA